MNRDINIFKLGEVAEITVPNGVLKFEIIEISRD